MLFFGAIEKERGGPADDEFVRALEPLKDGLAGYCRSVAGNRWDADDLLQETIAKAYVRYVHTGRAEFKKAYLYRIASNAWIDRIRRERELPMSLEWTERYGQRGAKSPCDAAIDTRWAVQTIVAGLPAKQRTALLLAEAFDLPLAEAARLMGTTEGAVKSLLRRGRDRLERLREAAYDAEAADETLVEAYLRALQTGDVNAIVALGNVSAAPTALALSGVGSRAGDGKFAASPASRAGLGFASVSGGACTFALLHRSGGHSCVRIVTAQAGDAIAV